MLIREVTVITERVPSGRPSPTNSAGRQKTPSPDKIGQSKHEKA